MTPSFTTTDANPVVIPDSNFEDVSLGTIPENLSNHLIVTGSVSLRILYQFVKVVRERKASVRESVLSGAAHSETPIVIVLETIPDIDATSDSIWNDIFSYKNVYIVKGRSALRETLLKASIKSCNRVVIFSTQGERESSSDAQSVFLIKLLQKVIF